MRLQSSRPRSSRNINSPTRWRGPPSKHIHFIGLSLLFGVVLVGNLRILGLMRNAAFVDIHRLLPWGVLGFVINSVTGMLFFIGQAFQYVDNPSFHWKVLFMLLAGANVLYLTLFDEVWALGKGEDAPSSAKLVAASQIFLWVGVILFRPHAAVPRRRLLVVSGPDGMVADCRIRGPYIRASR